MKTRDGAIRMWGVACLAMGTGWAGASAPAAVIETDAAVATTVQELIDGVPASVTSDSEQLDADSSNLPLAASGDLTSTALDGALVAMGQAFSEFSDPTRLDQPNPEEFALEAACYSNAESVSYSVTSSASEFRTIVFTTPGNPLAEEEIEFGPDLTRAITSRVFISGAVIFWSTDPGRNLEEMMSELRITVTREDTNASLFESTLTLAGAEAAAIQPTATGPLRFEVIGLDDLRDEGVDEGTISILEQVETDGTLIVVVIPPQEHLYTYTVTADEPLVLRAELEARVRNVPDGTGVAAALGRPFENLAAFIEEGLPGVNGAALEGSLNAATKSRTIGPVTAEIMPTVCSTPRLCGVCGFGSAVMLAVGLFGAFGRSRR